MLPTGATLESTYSALYVPLLLSYIHPPIVEHTLDVVLQCHDVLRHALTEDVNFMLQLCSLLARLFIGNPPVVYDLGAELGARSAKKIGFL